MNLALTPRRHGRFRSAMGAAILLGLIAAMLGLLVACGGSAGATPTTPDDGGATPTQDDGGGGSGEDPGAGESIDIGAGGDLGDRSKGSVQAEITGGYTGSIDLPLAAPLAMFNVDGSGGAYLPYTDPSATLFLTMSGGKDLIVQYAGPDAALASGATPCALQLDVLDDHQAKGSFDCKGLTLIQGEELGTADLSGTFDARP